MWVISALAFLGGLAEYQQQTHSNLHGACRLRALLRVFFRQNHKSRIPE